MSSSSQRIAQALTLTAALLGAASSARAASQNFAPVFGSGNDRNLDGIFDVAFVQKILTGVQGGARLPSGGFILLWEDRAALEFDLSGLPMGAVIDSASLSLAVHRPDFAGQTLISGYLGDGQISLADLATGAAVQSFTPVDSAVHAYDVSSFVQSAYGPASTWLGFNLRQSPANGNIAEWKTAVSGWTDPFLTVQYSVASVPEPQGYLLMLLGLGVVYRVRKQRVQAADA